MNLSERTALIRGGVPGPGGVWADFGAGTGAFTRALRACVGEAARLYAVDQASHALARQPDDVHTITADFTRSVGGLPPLDGALAANSLHFVQRQEAALRRLAGYLKVGGVLIVVEYDVRVPRGYIPYPLGRERCRRLLNAVGLREVTVVGERVSPSSGITMVAVRGLAART